MPLGSGLAGQIGWINESTYATPVTVTNFVPLVSESITQDRDRLESDAIIAGRRVLTSSQWTVGNLTVAGDIALELTNRGIGKLLLATFGTVVDAGSGPDGFTHTFTPGDLTGDSLTVQIGKPSSDGTVNPFTYPGVKVMSAELAADAGKIATLGVTVAGSYEVRVRTVADGVTTSASPTVTSATAAFTAEDVGKPISGTGIPAASYVGVVNSATSIGLSSTRTTNTPANASATGSSIVFTIGIALATASYPAAIVPMTFMGGGFTIASSAVKCKKFKLSIDNGLDDGRRFIGQNTIDEPLEADLRTYDGTMDLEFTSLTAYNRFIAASEAAVVASFSAGLHSMVITMNARFDGETPAIKDKGILMNSVPFKCVASGADSTAITAVLTNSDATT